MGPCENGGVRDGASPSGSGDGLSQRAALHAIVYDLEIQKQPDECMGGWEGVRRGEAGISCVVLYDNHTDRFHVYDEYDLEDCVKHLNSADILVSFNGIAFDTPILQSIVGQDVLPEQYDILAEVWSALPTRTKGYKLGDICSRLGLGEKVNNGSSAIELYANGRFGKLFDYCCQDVALTRDLARHIGRHGYIISPDGEYLQLPRIEV